MEKRMLIIHEDLELCTKMNPTFSNEFDVHSCSNGLQGLVKSIDWKPNVILLSSSLQNVDSVELCKQLRESTKAILFILSNDLQEDDIVKYYQAGADDVIKASISLLVLNCKIQVHLQHHIVNIQKEEDVIQFGDLVMNKLTYKIHYNQRELSFTRKEFAILWLLVKRQDVVVTRSELVKVVWSYEHVDDDRMVDTHLNRLRKKLKLYEMNMSIKTVWGIGYKLQLESHSAQLQHTN
ncbi:response regulator transcription factor [Bacillus sp. RG28]|uniref:Response regulator transcription factor n=1 Tax=Gottfriedia endophytica TaxID=2820819 RepID=A0A940NP02_9BACI|nr:response regulator transcription factor [Gottfriedia endophytica]MBP0724241.1 response regulator transcription factor [Gottfriedia endophytica]